MDFGSIVGFLSKDPISYAALQGIFYVSLADFILGTLKALMPPRTFKLEWLDAWVSSHLLKAVAIAFALLFGYVTPPITIGDFALNGIQLAALAAAGTYIAKTGASAIGNLNFGSPDPPPAGVDPTA